VQAFLLKESREVGKETNIYNWSLATNRLKKLARDKHSSLFSPFGCNNEKAFLQPYLQIFVFRNETLLVLQKY